ncbi:vacuolar protein sorting-associated protein 1 [Terramyces sp. JEL0728]|nr:vacuolar protein sorting-associated protein 1 [Terramyces sp. JEL0728]
MDTSLIETVNRLQEAFSTVKVQNPIDLPQITVVGSQSAGKSSVLENIVGKDFLPRGSGIVTRRPLVLQLVNSTGQDEFAEFLHVPGKKFTDFELVRKEIEAETDRTTSSKVALSPDPIYLKVTSPNVLTLTLVDLPGITKVPTGDQPKNIEHLIKEMILKFITKPNAIILAVTPANADIANSDGLKLARETDPDGLRTLGVMTKVDLMDPGTDLIDILSGKIVPLKFGYIPVVNRGQKDIVANKRITAALEAEKQFFENHPAYKNNAAFCGTPYLARRLSQILMMHIKACLPEIKAKISQMSLKYSQELTSLGDPMGLDDAATLSSIMLNVITEFTNEYSTVIAGTSNDISSEELGGGARISFVFHEIYASAIRSMDPFDQVKDVDIRTILYNSAGSAPSLFVGTAAFEILVKQQIKRLEDPSLKCCSMIYDELVRILTKLLLKPVFRRFPKLREKFYTTVINFFQKSMQPTQKLVSDIIRMAAKKNPPAIMDTLQGKNPNDKAKPPPPSLQQAAALTKDPNQDLIDQSNQGFFGTFFKQKTVPGQLTQAPTVLKPSGNLSEREQMETEVIKLLLLSYFNIVKRTAADLVPKAIMFKLVQYTKDELQRELLTELYKKEAFDEDLKESESVVVRRKECKKMLEALKKSDEIINSV